MTPGTSPQPRSNSYVRHVRVFGPQAKKTKLAVVVLIWSIACAGGMGMLWARSLRAGPQGNTPLLWPDESIIHLDKYRATLVMAMHPHCPCSRATIGELAKIMRSGLERVSAYVLFIRPADMPEGWEMTDLWQSAAAIPGVQVLSDIDGSEARRFRLETSGTVVLYESDGRLAFEGGITPGRGHAGDNAGSDAIIAVITGVARPAQEDYPTFGCALFDHGEHTIAKQEPRP